MATNMISGILDADQENIKSQLEYAKALRTKGLDTQGQMIGPHYVTKNPWQNFIEAATGAGVERYQRDKQRGIENEMENQRNAFLTSMPTSGDTRQAFDPNEQAFGPTQATVEQFVPKPTRQYAQQMREWATRAPKGMEGIQGFALQQAMTAPEKQAELEQKAKDTQAQMLMKAQEFRMAQQEKLDAIEREKERDRQLKMSLGQLAAGSRSANADLDRQLKEIQLETAKAKLEAGPKLTPTQEKEMYEADDIARNSASSLSTLKRARDLNSKAYSGPLALARATAAANMGFQTGSANNTIEFNNLVSGQALESLRTIFGGNPTEGERKILLDLQAAPSMTQAARERVLDNAYKAAEARMATATSKGEAIRKGTYSKAAPPVVTPEYGGAAPGSGGLKFNPITGKVE